MVVGFNHNFSYKGQVYHVQTEDSGIKNPHIVTLLYRGGTILSSKKTSYADIIRIDNLEAVVEELMKSQHREMLRLLKNGDLDELLGLIPSDPKAATEIAAPPPATPIQDTLQPPPAARTAIPPPTPVPPVATTAPAPPPPLASTKEDKKPAVMPAPAGQSLDEIILSYMVGEEKKS